MDDQKEKRGSEPQWIRDGRKSYAGLVLLVFVLVLAVKYWGRIAVGLALLGRSVLPLLAGCVIAYAMNILLVFFEKHYDRHFRGVRSQKMKRGLCITASFLSLIAIILLVIRLIVPQMAACVTLLMTDSDGALRQVVNLMNRVPSLQKYAVMIEKNFLEAGNIETAISNVLGLLMHGSGSWTSQAMSILQSVVSKVSTLFIGIFFACYLLGSKEKLTMQSKRLIRTYFTKAEGKILYLCQALNESFHSFIVGQVEDACVLGLMCTAGLLILRMPYAVMIGVIIAVTALVPIVGAILGAVVGFVLILSVSPVKALIFVIFFVVIQQVDNNVTYPRIVGTSVGLPGIWVLAAVTVGGTLFGVVGMLFFIPLFSTIYRLLQRDIRRRNAPAEEEPVIE